MAVVRVITGALTTSLEMAGVSLTIIKLNDPQWVELLGGWSLFTELLCVHVCVCVHVRRQTN